MWQIKKGSLVFLFLMIILSSAKSQDEKFVRIGERTRLFYGLNKIWNPQWFQGSKKSDSYFEGWYFKVVSDDGAHRFAFIPGISMGNDGHSFIQVINGTTGETQYHRFSQEEFRFSTQRFALWVGDNFFSADSFSLNLGIDENRIVVDLNNSNLNEYPVRLFSPGIMGRYRFAPFMECFHGVVSIHHQVNGLIVQGDDSIFVDNGMGYIEKDWGESMPEAWVWTQSNNFENNIDASFMLSVAKIPWIGRSFSGFLGFLFANGELYRFATYTRAKIADFDTEGDSVRIVIDSRKFTIEFNGLKGERGELLAPVAGNMERIIHESIDASIHVKLTDREGNVLFDDKAKIAGLELVGDTNILYSK